MRLIIDIPEIVYKKAQDGELSEFDSCYINGAVVNSTPLPKDATNGDIIKAMFPDVEVKEKNNGYEIYFGVGTCIQFFNHQWWNAPYKKGEEDAETSL